MKVFGSLLLIAAASAIQVDTETKVEATEGGAPNTNYGEHGQVAHDHYQLNDHYDNNDSSHHHYGGDQPASPAYPNAPEFTKAVDAFDTYGTLFGEHRYQLQVAKTGNMLIGTEALREAIAKLQERVHEARQAVRNNDKAIDNNDMDISYNRQLIKDNRESLHVLDGRISDLEGGYSELHHKLSIDREAIMMMCHQYAYAEAIPKECQPMIGGLSKPIDYRWNFPENECGPDPVLPPLTHQQPHYEADLLERKVSPMNQPAFHDYRNGPRGGY